MDDYPLHFKTMPATVILTDFVEGYQGSNYEVFLRELLNGSQHFLDKGKGEYAPPVSEEAGQCDAISKNYEIDFKLLMAQTRLRAERELRMRPHIFPGGLVMYETCRMPGTSMTTTRTHVALWESSVEDFEKALSNKGKGTDIDNDIAGIAKAVGTKKNVLLLFPYMFYFDEKVPSKGAIGIVRRSLSESLNQLLLYRERHCPGYDTYVTVEYEGQFLIFRRESGDLRFIEAVPTSRMPTYRHLLDYDDLFS